MSIIETTNSFSILPDSVLTADDLNIQSAKLLQPFYPDQGSSLFSNGAVGGKNQITFTLGSANCSMLPTESYLEFDVKANASTTATLAGDASCFFNRMRVVTSRGVVLVDNDEMALFQYNLNVNTIDSAQKACRWNSYMDQLNISDASSAAFTATSRHVVMPLPGSVWAQIRNLPLSVMGQVRIIFDLAPTFQVFSLCDAVSYRYQIDNPVLKVLLVPLTPMYQDKLISLARQGGLLLNYSSEYFTRQTCTATSNSITIQRALKSARVLTVLPKLSSEDLTYNLSYLKTISPTGGLISAQARAGSEFYPSSAMTTVEQVYVENMKAYKLWGDLDAGNQVTRANFSQAVNTSTDQKLSSKFSVVIDLSKGSINTGINTINSAVQFIYTVGTAVATLDAFCYLTYDSVVIVKSPDQIFIDF